MTEPEGEQCRRLQLDGGPKCEAGEVTGSDNEDRYASVQTMLGEVTLSSRAGDFE